MLKEGKQHALGSYDELVSAGIDLFSMIEKSEKPNETKEKIERQVSVSSHFSFKNRTISVLSGQSEVITA